MCVVPFTVAFEADTLSDLVAQVNIWAKANPKAQITEWYLSIPDQLVDKFAITLMAYERSSYTEVLFFCFIGIDAANVFERSELLNAELERINAEEGCLAKWEVAMISYDVSGREGATCGAFIGYSLERPNPTFN